MKRVAFKMKLKPDCKDEYIKRHAVIWPELIDLLHSVGVRNYSIYLDEETNTLFGFQNVEGEAGSQDLGNNPWVKKWWAHMADIMETNLDNSPVSMPLSEVFFMK